MTTNTTLARLQQLLPELFQPVQVIGDPYLRFQLTPEIPVLLSMERVQEALVVPANSISPLPNLPAFSIGLMNARDRVFLVVDLAQILGLPPLPINPRNYQVIVIQSSEMGTDSSESRKYIGLAVQRVRGVARFETGQLQSLTHGFPSCLAPYLLGSFGPETEQDAEQEAEQILVLDADSIVNSPALLKNPFVPTKPT
jgi:positive phototaxis protein PixI